MAQTKAAGVSTLHPVKTAPTSSHMLLENLSNLDPGSVHVLIGDSAPVRQEIQDLATKVDGCSFVLLEIPDTVDSAHLATLLVRELASIALGLWPHWYDDIIEVPENASTTALTALDIAATEAGSRYPATNLSWLRRAARSAHQSVAPVMPDTSATVQLDQLKKVISTTGLVLLLESDWPKGTTGDPLARQIENIAQASALTLVLISGENLLPATLGRFPRVLGAPARVNAPKEAIEPTFGPVIGRPHPNSTAERRLYEHIVRTEDLRHLFEWNQVLYLSAAATPKVDLVWHQGKLVVEIDGWADHSTREKFESDRLRDYELLAAGYVVLRVSNSEVLSDTELVMAKLRRLVRLQCNRDK